VDKKWVKIGIVAFFLISFALILGNLYRIISTTAPDFRILWISAKDFISNVNPYTDPDLFIPNAYPPVSELFYIPLALLPYQVSQAVFIFISFSSLIGSLYLSIKLSTGRVNWQYFLLFMGLAFFSFPTKYSLGMGQINIIVLFLLILCYYLASKMDQNFVTDGLLLGFAIALKPIFIFFLLFFAFHKDWKVVYVSILTNLFLILISLAFWPPEIWVYWFNTAIVPLSNFAGREAYVNQGLLGFISRFVADINTRTYLNEIFTILVITLAIIFNYVKGDKKLGFSLFIISLLLFDTTSWQHHFVWLIFPFIVIFYHSIKSNNIILLSLIFISYLLESWNFKNPNQFSQIFLSNQFYGNIILWGINVYLILKSHQKVTPNTKLLLKIK